MNIIGNPHVCPDLVRRVQGSVHRSHNYAEVRLDNCSRAFVVAVRKTLVALADDDFVHEEEVAHCSLLQNGDVVERYNGHRMRRYALLKTKNIPFKLVVAKDLPFVYSDIPTTSINIAQWEDVTGPLDELPPCHAVQQRVFVRDTFMNKEGYKYSTSVETEPGTLEQMEQGIVRFDRQCNVVTITHKVANGQDSFVYAVMNVLNLAQQLFNDKLGVRLLPLGAPEDSVTTDASAEAD
jgi:hypothetical protein